MRKKNIFYLVLLILLIIIDQISKFFIVNYLNDSFILIKNFLSFSFIKNTGAAFGMFSGSTFKIIMITLLLIIYLFYDMHKNFDKKLNVIFNILILSGAIGNLIDRVFRGYVVDFVSFILFNRQMPVFNIADIFITFGVIGLIFVMFKEEKNERDNCK